MFTPGRAHVHDVPHDILKILTTGPGRRRLLPLIPVQLLLLISSITQVCAAPTLHVNLHVRQSIGGQTTTIWVPIVVVIVLLTLAIIIAFSKRSFRGGLSGWGAGAALASGSVSGTGGGIRVVTADELVSNRNSNTNTNTSSNSARAQSRAPRRTRRTPSQISTTSLPAYMKEPGDEEVVVSRGPNDMEDADSDSEEGGNRRMPPVAENDSDGHPAHAPEYNVVPPSAHDMPLLQNVESRDSANDSHDSDHSQQHLMAHTGFASYTEGSSSFLNPQEILDRGEAPPYFEVVAMDSQDQIGQEGYEDADAEAAHPRSDPFASPSPAPTEDDALHTEYDARGARRRTGIFSIFMPRLGAVPQGSSRETTRHTRELSATSLASSDEGRPLTLTSTRHRASQSASGNSVLSLGSSVFRTRSRSQTNLHQPMTSPSMISLNSISAPLTHTLVRTEFTYPKSGPTPQQLKLIASRESVARFGVPYGPDAVAYAASTSRVDLEPPPPGFDEVFGNSSSGLRIHTDADDTVHSDEEAPEVPAEEVGSSEAPSPAVAVIPHSPDLAMAEWMTYTQSAPSEAEATSAEFPASSLLSVPSSSTTVPATIGSISRKPAPLLSKSTPPISFKTAEPNTGVQSRVTSLASSLNTFVTADETIHSPSPPASPSAHSLRSPSSVYTESFNVSSEAESSTIDSTPRLPALRIHESASLSTESISITVEAH